MKKYIISFLILSSTFAIGFISGRNTNDKLEIIRKGKIEGGNVVKRNYDIIPNGDYKDDLIAYDNMKGYLDIEPLNNNPLYNFRMTASLHKRTWNRNVKIGESGNWNFYIGIGFVGAIAGGFIAYKLMKK